MWDRTTKSIVAVILVVLVGIAFLAVRPVFVPLIIGSITAYVLYPLVRQIREWLGVSHGVATWIVYLLLIALLIPAFIVGIPILVRQTAAFQQQLIGALESLDAGQTIAIPMMGEVAIEQVTTEVTNALITLLSNVFSQSIQVVTTTARFLIFTVITFLVGFYLTRDGAVLLNWLFELVPPSYEGDLRKLLDRLDRVWRSFLRGQIILSSTVAVILTIISAILGLPQPFLLGLWGGLLEFLPSIGNVIWGATAVTLALTQGSTNFDLPTTTFVIIVIITYVAFAQIDINFLIPNIIGGQVQLHPMVVLIGVIIGLNIGGVLGVALAAPTIASLRVIGWYIYAKLFDMDPFPPQPAKQRKSAAKTPA